MKTKITFYLSSILVCILCQSQVSNTSRNTNESTELSYSGEAKAITDQVILDDLIVVGSACVGQDCNNGESFGFDTQRYKENNLRVHFDDTSNSASFPNNDWRIRINDSSNGGANYFAVENSTAGRTPFRIDGSAPTNSLYVRDNGNIGIGTSTPVVETHITDGDTPTIRIEQNGSSGFTPQTWDMAGNETNFFVRDVTNGSKLPFRIFPNSPTSSIEIKESGVNIKHVGLIDASSPSDKRLKTNIVALRDATNTLLQLQPVTYMFKKQVIDDFGFSANNQIGLVAQDVKEVLPQIIKELTLEDSKEYLSVNYEALIPVLIKGFQEQQEIIDQQAKELEHMKGQIQKYAILEARLDALEEHASTKSQNTKR